MDSADRGVSCLLANVRSQNMRNHTLKKTGIWQICDLQLKVVRSCWHLKCVWRKVYVRDTSVYSIQRVHRNIM